MGSFGSTLISKKIITLMMNSTGIMCISRLAMYLRMA